VAIGPRNQARASVFAEKSYGASLISKSEDSTAAQKMHALVRNPAKHYCFGLCSWKWRANIAMKRVAIRLAGEQLDRWLFRLSEG
jgi:hypothetical protein